MAPFLTNIDSILCLHDIYSGREVFGVDIIGTHIIGVVYQSRDFRD
jgi:hypothetical protein